MNFARNSDARSKAGRGRSGVPLTRNGKIIRLPKKPRPLYLRDDDGVWTGHGATVRFNYGIPPTVVDARVVQRGNKLIALAPGHEPEECNLRSLRRYVGSWYRREEMGHVK